MNNEIESCSTILKTDDALFKVNEKLMIAFKISYRARNCAPFIKYCIEEAHLKECSFNERTEMNEGVWKKLRKISEAISQYKETLNEMASPGSFEVESVVKIWLTCCNNKSEYLPLLFSLMQNQYGACWEAYALLDVFINQADTDEMLAFAIEVYNRQGKKLPAKAAAR